MATTKIHAISARPNECLNYAIKDKVGEYRDSIADGINYSLNHKTGDITYKTVSSFTGGTHRDSILNDFYKNIEKGQKTRAAHKVRTKTGEDYVAWHLHQNFEGFEVSPLVANEIGRKLAEELFPNFPCVIGTHTNTENIHNHIVFCAYNNENGKHNNDNAFYQKIRKVSDRLCREYGLKVLDNTEQVKLIKFVDKNGKTRYYEPTDRKNQLIEEREKGVLKGGLNHYRNTPSYQELLDSKEANRDIIKSDIDMLLPSVRSYDELLDQMRELGYQIKDKTKNDDWRQHVSFVLPTGGKATRDGSLGDGEFYKRENLTAYIENNYRHVLDIETPVNVAEIDGIKYFDSYNYPDIDISDINTDYRIRKSQSGNFEIVPRSIAEQDTIGVIRRLDMEIRETIDTAEINRIVDQQRAAKERKQKFVPQSKNEVIVTEIENTLRSLYFMERNNMQSYGQVNDMYKTLCANYACGVNNLAELESLVEHYKAILELPTKINNLEQKMIYKRNDTEYVMENQAKDADLIQAHKQTMEKYKIDTDDGFNALQNKILDAEARKAVITNRMMELKERMSEYENCIAVFEKMASHAAANKFDAIKRDGERTGREVEAVKKERRRENER